MLQALDSVHLSKDLYVGSFTKPKNLMCKLVLPLPFDMFVFISRGDTGDMRKVSQLKRQ
mgnify:FL=1